MFKVGDIVAVPSAGYSGEVIEVRKTGRKYDYLVRYVVPGARRPFYETWWPTSHLELANAGGDK